MLTLAMVGFLVVGCYLFEKRWIKAVEEYIDDLGLTPRVMDKAWLDEIERLSK